MINTKIIISKYKKGLFLYIEYKKVFSNILLAVITIGVFT